MTTVAVLPQEGVSARTRPSQS